MRKFKSVNELVNTLKPDYPVYCIRPDVIKKSVNFFKENFHKLSITKLARNIVSRAGYMVKEIQHLLCLV